MLYVSEEWMVHWLVTEWNVLRNDAHDISGADSMTAEYSDCPVHSGVDCDFEEFNHQTGT